MLKLPPPARRHALTHRPPSLLLDVEGMTFSRGAGNQRFTVEVPALKLRPGELVAITGRSGSGKSTVLELLGLLSAPHRHGRFLWRGHGRNIDLGKLWNRRAHGALAEIRGTSMGFVLQTHGLLPFLTVAGNLALIRRSLGLPPRDAHLDAMIERLDIGGKLHKKPHELSVGEQQRASIVRALAHRPALVLADEPTSALDPGLGDRVMDLLLAQAKEHGIAVLIATHEVDRVAQLGLRTVSGTDQKPATGFAWRFAD
ncbi:ABC transporter ATP-binding protein [Lamprocystis purpurea]|jgi:putative ABC transport system ATP-binding protein|uniref:ABC transporter ATP-binding protein n=1 Tax=Lamprocystis purpurea TaxID=61598 RepID=UPI00037FD3C4|nr:ATP-binding cassette domain-containing protein [Lamprocystis purpurea]